MVFCNNGDKYLEIVLGYGHNPYFNRWFSAIMCEDVEYDVSMCHNPYFNRWFSAIVQLGLLKENVDSHNPYFNRWFSAIGLVVLYSKF